MDSAKLTDQFSRDGYLIIPRLYTREECAALKTEIRRVLDEVRREAEAAGRDPDVIAHTGVYVGLAARSPMFREALRDPRLLDVLEAVMAPNIAFLSDKAVFKSATTEYASPWHQDYAYWLGSHKFSVWVALDDVTPENGALKVLPGSHRQFVSHQNEEGENRFNNRVRPEDIDESRAVTASMEAGGAVFFHDLTLHASHPNTSGAERYVWIPTYRDAQAEDPPYSFAVAAAPVRGEGQALPGA